MKEDEDIYLVEAECKTHPWMTQVVIVMFGALSCRIMAQKPTVVQASRLHKCLKFLCWKLFSAYYASVLNSNKTHTTSQQRKPSST